MNYQLGISLYPDKAPLQELKDYVDLAVKNNFGLVFINLIDVLEKNNQQLIATFKEIINYCKSKGMKVTIDVNGSTFKTVNLDFNQPDLKYFADLNIDTLRLDEQFNGLFEATLTYNPYGIEIELNPSVMSKHLENILSYRPVKQNLKLLHNFYPQKLTGLSYEKFKKLNKEIHQSGLRIGAFITISDHESTGPWDVSENLPTLELHRFLPIGIQLNHLISNNYADYIYISTQFATQEDFDQIKQFHSWKQIIPIELNDEIGTEEKTILEYPFHFIRGDINDYFYRSTQTRKIFKDFELNPKEYTSTIIPKGSIMIPNSSYGKYKGELQIALQDLVNDGKRNIVGKVLDDCLYVLGELGSWTHFELSFKK